MRKLLLMLSLLCTFVLEGCTQPQLRITTYAIVLKNGSRDTVTMVHKYEPTISNDGHLTVYDDQSPGPGSTIRTVCLNVVSFSEIRLPDTLQFYPNPSLAKKK